MKTEPERVRGEFCPPEIPKSKMPVPIAGSGFLELRPDVLHLSGFKATRTSWRSLALMALILAGFALVFLIPTPIALGLFCIGGIALLATSKKIDRAQVLQTPLELEIPWRSVAGAAVGEEPGEVVIDIENHRPKGPVHFMPADGQSEILLERFNERVVG